MSEIKKTDNNKCWWGCEKSKIPHSPAPHSLLVEVYNGIYTLEKNVSVLAATAVEAAEDGSEDGCRWGGKGFGAWKAYLGGSIKDIVSQSSPQNRRCPGVYQDSACPGVASIELDHTALVLEPQCRWAEVLQMCTGYVAGLVDLEVDQTSKTCLWIWQTVRLPLLSAWKRSWQWANCTKKLAS